MDSAPEPRRELTSPRTVWTCAGLVDVGEERLRAVVASRGTWTAAWAAPTTTCAARCRAGHAPAEHRVVGGLPRRRPWRAARTRPGRAPPTPWSARVQPAAARAPPTAKLLDGARPAWRPLRPARRGRHRTSTVLVLLHTVLAALQAAWSPR
ncbi:hypothetical protein QJS66_11310 [Kocuria rhizophila]|nr:hypothetical protein QJS66_11310 [Kocuria rhizophila]